MDSDTSYQFGMLLRELRGREGLSQEALADLAGLSPKAIGTLERGERRRPHPRTVRALADALRLTGATRAQFLSEPTTAIHRRRLVEADSADGSPQVSVVVLSDNRLHSRRFVARLVEAGVDVLVRTATFADALAVTKATEADVLILDVEPTPGHRRDLASAVRTDPELRVVATVDGDFESTIMAWVRAGVYGLVSSVDSAQHVLSVLQAPIEDQLTCSPRIAGTVLRSLRVRDLNERQTSGEALWPGAGRGIAGTASRQDVELIDDSPEWASRVLAPDPATFADVLRQARRTAGFSQVGLARAAGLSPDTISRLEAGSRLRPHEATVIAISKALDLNSKRYQALRAAANRGVASERDINLAMIDRLRVLIDRHRPELRAPDLAAGIALLLREEVALKSPDHDLIQLLLQRLQVAVEPSLNATVMKLARRFIPRFPER